MSESRKERYKESERESSGDRGDECYNSDYGRGAEMKKIAMGETNEEDDIVGSSSRSSDRGNERVSRRGIRDTERAGGSGDRIEVLPKESVSEQSSRVARKKGGKVDGSWDESEDGKGISRVKRSREDDRRDRSRVKERSEGREDSDDGSRFPSRRRGEDGRGYRQQTRSEDWGEVDGGARPSSRVKSERTDDDRIDRARTRDRTEPGKDESEDGFRSGGRGRNEMGEDEWVEKPKSGGGERISDVSEEAGRFSGRARSENDSGEKYRDSLGRERAEGTKVVPDNSERFGGRDRGNEDRYEKQKSRDGDDGGRGESEDGEKAAGRRRGGKSGKETRSSVGRKGTSGDWGDAEWDWNDDEDFEQERARGEREKDRHRSFERGRGREKDNDGMWERDRRREREEHTDRPSNRMRDRYREGGDKGRESAQDFDRKRDRAERERSGRERIDRGIGDRERLERERGEGLSGPNGAVLLNESTARGVGGGPMPFGMDPGRGILSEEIFFPRVGADSGGLQGEFMGGSGDAEWDGPGPEERARGGDSGYNDSRERHPTDDEPPPGLEQGLGPNRGGGNDGGMPFNLGGRGRGKGSPSNRSRGGMILHEGRPNFLNNQGGAGMMMRGMQPGGKGGRGGRGPGKVGRGGGRDGQRGNMAVIPQMGPGMPGPLFGQLGPPGPPIAGLGPGIMGPGAFPLPPFGGRMGWNGGGDMGMMNGPPGPGPGPLPGPPRFVPGMGPGPPGLGPNMFFNSPGPARGPGPIPLGGMFGANAPFGGRPMPGDRNPPGGRSVARGGGPAGRGPSRGEQNDYSQHFVDTGLRPQNFIRDVELADRFEEYPKLKELIARKDKLISERATPPMFMQCDLRTTELRPEVFGTKFDVILVDPPWEEYVHRAPGVGDSMEWWSHSDIQNLRIEAISDNPAFIFLWVGDAEGLDQGRLCLKKWGFRRCEDICWVKTNRENPTPALRHDANTVLQHSKEHCLMGIKGTVRRSTDGHIIHANVDTDIIISEEPEYGSTAKPEELYHIIEHFAQGQRRIELFGEDHNIRAGWVTVGKGLSSSNFSPQTYAKHFFDGEGKVWQGGRGNPPSDAPHLVGTTSEIESLRPKSPPPRAQQQQPQTHAPTTVQPSATNAISKRTSSISQGGLQSAPSVPGLAPGAGHASTVPAEIGPGGGKAIISHAHISVVEETVISHDTKQPGLQHVILTDKVVIEERSFATDVVDVVPSEGEAASKTEFSKPAPF